MKDPAEKKEKLSVSLQHKTIERVEKYKDKHDTNMSQSIDEIIWIAKLDIDDEENLQEETAETDPEIMPEEADSSSEQPEETSDYAVLHASLQDHIITLKEQLESLNQQLNAKDQQIAELHGIINREKNMQEYYIRKNGPILLESSEMKKKGFFAKLRDLVNRG